MILKCDFKSLVLGVNEGIFDFGIDDVAGEGFLDVADAVADVVGVSLCEHFDGSVRQISDKAGQFVSAGYVKSRKAKADTLYPA